MAFWRPVQYKNKKIVRQFGDGLNKYLSPFAIKESELTKTENMCADDYPAIRTRNDRYIKPLESYYTTSYGSALTGLGNRNNKEIHAVIQAEASTAGTGFKWVKAETNTTTWETISQISSTYRNMYVTNFVDFNTEAYLFTVAAVFHPFKSKGITLYSPYAYNGTTNLVSLTSDAPNSHMYTAYNYRLFGVSTNFRTVKYSALGTCTDWATTLNAGNFDVTNAKGPITAITTYQNKVIIWTENSMHILYGTEPLNYAVIDVSLEIGCIGQFAFTECKGKLYFANYDGIYVFTGGMPKKISDKVNSYFESINKDLSLYFLYAYSYEYFSVYGYRTTDFEDPVSVLKYFLSIGNKDDKIYISIPTVINSNNVYPYYTPEGYTLVYDTKKDVWFTEKGYFKRYTNIAGNLYGSDEQDYIVNMDTKTKTGFDSYSKNNAYETSTAGTTIIPAYFETKPFNDFQIDKEIGIKDVWLLYQGTTTADMTVSYSTNLDSTTYNTLIPTTDITFTSTEPIKDQYMIPTTSIGGCPYYRFKFQTNGHVKLDAMQINAISYGED